MKTGTATVDITPEVGCELSGYVARVQPSLGIHDPLFARALYLEAVGRRLLWLHTDLIGFEWPFVCALREEFERRFGLKPAEIVVSATHTHSGPGTLHLINLGAYDAGYVAKLRGRLVEVAARAVAQTEETETVAGEGHCELSIDRRGQASAHTDPKVGVLAWRRGDGSYSAVLANYAMHNVGWGSDNRRVSADVFGRAAATLAEGLAGSPTVLFTNGACGNTNPPSHAAGTSDIETWGEAMAASVVDALEHAAPVDETAFRMAAETVAVPLDVPDAEQVRGFAQDVLDSVAGQPGYVPERVAASAETWRDLMLGKLGDGSAPTHVPMDVQAVRIGSVRLVCLGAEVFSSMGDELRAATGQTVYVVGYANGEIGYLPTAVAYEEGGYEVCTAFIYYGSFRPKPGAFEMVRDKAVGLVNGL